MLKSNRSANQPTVTNTSPLWRLGFRPFFLASTIAATISLLCWIGVYAYGWPLSTYFPPQIWHAHEMLFGFVGAVVVGFVLTASQNWAGKPGISGVRLKILATIWLAARLMPFFVSPPNMFYAIVDLMFLALAAVFLLNYVPKEHSHRTIAVLINMLVLWAGNALVHLGTFLGEATWSMGGLRLGLGALIFMVLAIGGRIIPTFSRNKFPSAPVRDFVWLDALVQLSAVVFVFIDAIDPSSKLVAIVAAIVASLNFGRWLAWGPHHVRSEPMLVFLYIAYFWMIVGFTLRAFSSVLPFTPGAITHAFAVGGIGIMIYSMIPRVSLGHTGRPIAADRWIMLGFVAINLAALIRVIVAGLWSTIYVESVIAAGVLWIVAFLLLGVRFISIWLSPRIDGKFG